MAANSELAVANLVAQHELAASLEHARIISGRSVDDVAALLGIDRSLVEEALRGERDLTLTELRLLAFAVDALVEYEVESATEE